MSPRDTVCVYILSSVHHAVKLAVQPSNICSWQHFIIREPHEHNHFKQWLQSESAEVKFIWDSPPSHSKPACLSVFWGTQSFGERPCNGSQQHWIFILSNMIQISSFVFHRRNKSWRLVAKWHSIDFWISLWILRVTFRTFLMWPSSLENTF